MKLCTKLVQWLTIAVIFFSIWSALVADVLPIAVSKEMYQVILILPVYAVICFGCYSLGTIGYKLMIFNDCENAASELMKEVTQAKEDLASKGFKF